VATAKQLKGSARRVFMDAKAVVKLGNFSRGGKNRVKLSRVAMAKIEEVVERLPNLKNWFVKIPCPSLLVGT
jgi:hypothetical protein